MAKNIEGSVNIINTLSQANDQDFPIAMAEDISMNDGSRVEDRINALHNYTHPSTSGYKHIPSGGETDDVLLYKSDGEAQWGKIPDATTTTSGLMNKDDKSKLDGIASGANNYIHPSYTNHSNDLYKVSVDSNGHVSAVTKVIKDDITALGIPAQDTTYEVASSSKAGLMSISDKSKLDGIASGANNYIHPSYTERSNGLYKITVDNLGHVIDVSSLVKSDITNLGIPAQDTTYSEATTSKSGLMSASDKLKLDNVPEDFSDYSHPTYTERSSGLYKITVDKLGHVSGATVVTKSDITALGIPSSDTDTWTEFKGATEDTDGTAGYVPAPSAGASNRYFRSDGTWAVPPDTNTTYDIATTNTNGLMSASDKSKLDGIASGANNYTHPSYTERSSGLYKITVDNLGHVIDVSSVSKSDITNLGIPAQDTAYSEATTSKSGLMSASDKSKLDGIASGANNYIHPSYTSKTSGLYKITIDASGHVSDATVVTKSDITALGIPSSNTTYNVASSSANGLMSAADKSKLDGIASGANNYIHPSYKQRSSGLYKITVDESGHVSNATAVTKSDLVTINPGLQIGFSTEQPTELNINDLWFKLE